MQLAWHDAAQQDYLQFRMPLDQLEAALASLIETPVIAASSPHRPSYPGPTLFLAGRQSAYVSDADWPSIRAHWPRAVLARLDAGHWLHAEQPVAFCEAVARFYLEHHASHMENKE